MPADVNELVELRARQRTFHGAYSRTAIGALGYALTILRLFDPAYHRSECTNLILRERGRGPHRHWGRECLNATTYRSLRTIFYFLTLLSNSRTPLRHSWRSLIRYRIFPCPTFCTRLCRST